MRYFGPWLLIPVLVSVMTVAVAAQTLTLPKSEYIVGEEIVAAYTIPSETNTERPWVGVYRIPDGARMAYERGSDPKEGRVTLRAPADPGAFEVRLVLQERVVASQPISTIVTPVPQGLNLDKQAFVIGESIRVTVTLPPGRYYNYPWVGLFEVGRLAPGGAAIADRRIAWHRVKNGDEVTFTAPSLPGEYEVRLYDRDETRYILDQRKIAVYADPTPGALSLPKTTFVVGETIPLSVDLPEGRYLSYPWVGLFDPVREVQGGAERAGGRLSWQRVSKDGTITFQAPNVPGQYELRLYDRDENRFVLDTIVFVVEVPPVPGALTIDKDTYVVGETISVRASLPPGRYYDHPWVGLFTLKETAQGGAGITETRLAWQRVPQNGVLTFNAPNHPGRYEFRLYDRDENRYLLDTLQFVVEVPPVPGALTIDKDTYVVGETISVRASLPPGRYYDHPWVGLFTLKETAQGGAGITETRLAWQRVPQNGVLTFNAPNRPGRYEFRLYDRDSWGYALDKALIHVVTTPVSTLQVERERYQPGELVRVQVRVPEERYSDRPWVGLVRSAYVAPGGALAGEHLLRSFAITRDTRRLELEAPREPGRYELRLHDRDANFFILAAASFEVYNPAAPHLAFQPHPLTPLPGTPADDGLPLPAPTTDSEPRAEQPDGPGTTASDSTGHASAEPSVQEQPDPWSMPLEDLRDRYARQDADLVESAREANRLAREVDQLDRLIEDASVTFPLTEEDLQRRLEDVQRRIAAAPESHLPQLLAERAVLERLMQAGAPITEEDAAGVRNALFREWEEQYGRFREGERARNETLGVLVAREGALRSSSEDELGNRLIELQEGLDRPEAFGLTERELPALRREAEDIKAELARRQRAEADLEEVQRQAAHTAEREIHPQLETLRRDLARAAAEEDVAVGHVLAGREPLVDASGKLNPGALLEDSLFARVADLPMGPARSQSSLNYLETWAEFNDKVAPTLEDRLLGDSPMEALMFNSQSRADMRVKAASLLAEEAPAIIEMMNRTEAPRELRDLNGERLSRVIAQLYSPGRTITGEDRARSNELVNDYLAQAIASSAASVAQAHDVARAIERGEAPSEQLAAQARRNGLSPLEQARLNARLRASDLGYLLGAIEAGHIRAGFDEVQRLKAEEEAVKAFTKLLFDVGMAPFPSPGKLLPGAAAPYYDALKSTMAARMQSQLLTSGVPATEERLRQAFREDVTRFRDIPTYLLPPESQDLLAHELYTMWQQTRLRVSQDPLNQPGR